MDYKKYSLEQLDNWVHDAITSAEASPQEIYDTIKKVVEEQYYYYKDRVSKCYELLALLNGNGKALLDNSIIFTKEPSLSSSYQDDVITNYKTHDEMIAEGYEMTDDGFWVPLEKSKVNKWVLPVEVDDVSGEYFVTFPDDMLEQLGWKDGDNVEFVDNKNGSFTIKKVP